MKIIEEILRCQRCELCLKHSAEIKETTKFIKGRFYTKEYDTPKGET